MAARGKISMSAEDHKQDTVGRIVAAYATRSDVSPDDIVALYHRLSCELAEQGLVEAVAPATSSAALRPAVPLDRAYTEDKVFCLCCGRGFKMLKRHLGAEHGMTEAEYRAAFGLPEDFPLVAPSYSQKKAAHAKEAGLGRYTRSLPVPQE